MATTTNYAWETPDDTDLVKDGAAAIRTLGSSIDTTTKALNPSTTLGDVEYRSSTANTNTRLPIGTTGQVLTVTGGVPAWETISAGGMTLLSTTALSGATVTISGISGSYTHLFLYVYGITNATNSNAFRIAPNGQTNITSSFGSSSGTTVNTLASSYLYPHGDLNILRTDANNAFGTTIYNYANTSGYKPYQSTGGFLNTSSARAAGISAGTIDTNSAITSLVLSSAGGALSTGTALLYGVK